MKPDEPRPPILRSQTALWTRAVSSMPAGEATGLAREFEQAGLSTLWVPELARGPDVFTLSALLLAETTELCVGSAVASALRREPEAAAGAARALLETFGDRFALGLGVSHAEVRRGSPRRPSVSTMEHYLEAVEAGLAERARRPLRLVAALGPRMLGVARDRADGAITFLTTPDHTAEARATLGDSRRLVVVQAITSPGTADPHDVAQAHVRHYGRLANYRRHLARLGLIREAVALDDQWARLANLLVAGGSEDAVIDRVDAHLAAGADQVCIDPLQTSTADAFRWSVELAAELSQRTTPREVAHVDG